jgi:peptidoglycan/LPS O-acetylase OafA/YrhL
VIEHGTNLSGFGVAQLFPSVSLGQMGVALFFILSGYVISLSMGHYTRPGFAISRVFRIYPTYIVAFGLILSLAYVRGEEIPAPTELFQSLLLIRDFFGAGIDPVAWTLQIEIKFYVVCAVALPLFSTRSRWLALIPVILFAVTLISQSWPPTAAIVTVNVAAFMIIYMFIGVAFFLHQTGAIGSKILFVSMMLGALSTYICWVIGPMSATAHLFGNYLPPIVVFAICYFQRDLINGNAVFRYLSAISYPLYVVHLPTIMLFTHLGRISGFSLGVSTFAGVFGAIIAATAIHFLVENPSHRVGKRIASSIKNSEVPVRVKSSTTGSI